MAAPIRASSSAVARPMPRPAPVTIATCPSSSIERLLPPRWSPSPRARPVQRRNTTRQSTGGRAQGVTRLARSLSARSLSQLAHDDASLLSEVLVPDTLGPKGDPSRARLLEGVEPLTFRKFGYSEFSENVRTGRLLVLRTNSPASSASSPDASGGETETWITEHLGPDYPWPGNVRERCVRNVMIRGEYR